MVITNFKDIKISAMAAAVSNNWTALSEISDEDESVIKKFSKKQVLKVVIMQGLDKLLLIFVMLLQKQFLKRRRLTQMKLGYWFSLLKQLIMAFLLLLVFFKIDWD